ncbi:MAG: hypothetical protein A2X86_12530 [Bdellovibrionales bacterium GWA2_49_15]|nr:MAG: hypothetical protein A2X86_12530 [Bdellovibrionales bacterium GWA2_49_15]HAZ14678.1 hypothetical protein [Bdellovibrionales bacterium]
MAQHATLHVQSSEKSASQQINTTHTKAHECPYCSFFKEHSAKIIFATSLAIIFENLPDLVVVTNSFLDETVLIFHSARAPPAVA